MKKAIIIICVIGALLLILDSVNAANSLLLFLFAGVIPGTNLLVSPIDMMAATATALTIIMLRLTAWPRMRGAMMTSTQHVPRTKRATHRAA